MRSALTAFLVTAFDRSAVASLAGAEPSTEVRREEDTPCARAKQKAPANASRRFDGVISDRPAHQYYLSSIIGGSFLVATADNTPSSILTAGAAMGMAFDRPDSRLRIEAEGRYRDPIDHTLLGSNRSTPRSASPPRAPRPPSPTSSASCRQRPMAAGRVAVDVSYRVFCLGWSITTIGLATHARFAFTVWHLVWFLKRPLPGDARPSRADRRRVDLHLRRQRAQGRATAALHGRHLSRLPAARAGVSGRGVRAAGADTAVYNSVA